MTDHLDTVSDALADRYGVQRKIGEGGMATVFQATDLKHQRQVALKVLKPELAAVIGAERFLQEIQLTAGLQHPNILALYDSGQADSILYYVMPLIEGESLRERIEREKQLELDEALRITEGIAAALDYAHEREVIHRDIKPANILFQSGQPLVADFGIALAVTEAGGGRLTETGLSLGTPHYMSPEQATGDREVTARTDVYSLGCVLYEMLAGETPYPGGTAQSVLAKLLTEKPRAVSSLRSSVPVNVDHALQKALAKAPADRFATASEFVQALKDQNFRVATDEPVDEPPGLAKSGGRSRLAWGVAMVTILVAAAGWFRPAQVPETTRTRMGFPGEVPVTPEVGRTFVVSPDGRSLIYRGSGPNGIQLYRLDENSLRPRPIDGTANASGPFFSPDGEALAFFADSRLKRVSVAGGPAVELAEAGSPRGGVWLDNGDIVFTPSTGEGLWRTAGDGSGEAERLTLPDAAAGEVSHRFPSTLPGGDAVLFTVFTGNFAEARVGLLDTETLQAKTIVDGAFHAAWLPTGHISFVSPDGTLFVQRFDLDAREVVGGAEAIAPDVRTDRTAGTAEYSFSPTGVLVYGLQPEGRDGFYRVERDGSIELIVDSLPSSTESMRFSADGNSLAFGMDAHIWRYDLQRGGLTQLTYEGTNRYPSWTRDGSRITFNSRRPGSDGLDLYGRPADGSGQIERFFAAPYDQWEHVWAPTGELVFRQTVPGTSRDIWYLPEEDAEPVALRQTSSNERAINVSPDGRWLSYVSDESGRDEVYVRPFPQPDGKFIISDNGGQEPVWSPDGNELFYRSGSTIWAASLIIEQSVRVAERVPLFDDAFGTNPDRPEYDVHPTEGWFIFGRYVGPRPEVVRVTNWFPEIRDIGR